MEVKTKLLLVLSILLATFHLVASLLHYSGTDWIIQWYTSVYIADGIPIYEQGTKSVDGQYIMNTHHFPFFFNVFAYVIKLGNFNPVFGRVFLWLCTILLAIFIALASNPVEQKDKWLVIVLFLVNVQLAAITYIGLFDQFVSLFMIAGLYLGQKSKKLVFWAGILLGLGTMSKLYPIIAAGVLGLAFLKRKQFLEALLLAIGFLASAGSMVAYYYLKYGQQFLETTILWQAERFHYSSSFWYYYFPDIKGDHFLVVQILITMMSLIAIIPILRTSNNSQIDNAGVYFGVTVMISVFVILLRVSYPHYLFWIFSSSLPGVGSIIDKMSKRDILLWYLPYLIAAIGGQIWTSATYDPLTDIGLQKLGSITLAFSLLSILFWNFLYWKKKIDE